MSNGLWIQAVLKDVNIFHNLQLTSDSTALASLSTTIEEPQERLNKIKLAAIRKPFNDGQLGAVHWCSWQKRLSDALTKDNRSTAKLMHIALVNELQGQREETRRSYGLSTFKHTQDLRLFLPVWDCMLKKEEAGKYL